ncbi:MAG: hypothetical protein IJ297_01060 [Clostridia bacterium]|nr:hypothetical protein [Clostridia bacterium]
MTAEKMKKYPGMVVVKKETEVRLKKLREEIEELEGRMSRAQRKCEDNSKVVTLLEIKQERLRVTQSLLDKIERSTLEVEEALDKIAPSLTPLEHVVILKLYIEGLRWNQLMDLLQTNPEYSRFCYERSTYMRAHRSALDKLMTLDDEEQSVSDTPWQ